ncbi:MAG: NAD(P)-binding protein [Desulfovibrio sp.]|nr:NAD(P)-binding protein [Desulfovibrio sp.]
MTTSSSAPASAAPSCPRSKKEGQYLPRPGKRPRTGGNIRSGEQDGINVHAYGAHIFHTSDRKAWNCASQSAEFNSHVNSPVANWKGESDNLPFSMNTFSRMWGISAPGEARRTSSPRRPPSRGSRRTSRSRPSPRRHRHLREARQGYTEKQRGRSCTDLAAFIITRRPVRFTCDSSYSTTAGRASPWAAAARLPRSSWTT